MASRLILDVHARLPGGQSMLAAQVAFGPPARNSGAYEAAFRYDPAWLSSPRGFDLDPVHLPRSLGTGEVSGQGLRPAMGCLDDALPDAWGRSLLREALRDSDVALEGALMRLVGAGALGALAFSEPGAAPRVPEALGVRDLGELLDAAGRFERNEELDSALMRRLLAAGGSPGGARPKALVSDAAGMWIAKFPSPSKDAGRDNVGMERVCLEIGRLAGLDVPENRIERVGRRRVLLVRRFDIPERAQDAVRGARHRYHGVSMATLTGETATRPVYTYQAMADALRRVSAEPAKDLAALFRHALVNAAIGNTDDHLRNFRMRHTEHGWRLAPAFDLLPDVLRKREHTLDFHYARTCPDGAAVKKMAGAWGVPGAERVLDEVCGAAAQFAALCEQFDVPATDRDFFNREITTRIATLRSR